MSGPFAYVRVKRGKTTAFVVADVEGGATGLSLRQDSATALGVDLAELRLLRHNHTPIDDGRSLAEQGVVNTEVVCAVFRGADGEWESPYVAAPGGDKAQPAGSQHHGRGRYGRS